jgi:hypothetical protein
MNILLFGFSFLLVFTFFVGTAGGILGGKNKEALAFGTGFAGGLAPVSVFAVWVFITGVEGAAAARSFFNNFSLLTGWTGDASTFFNFFDVFAVGVARAAQERTKAAAF